jgi:hypothetical protein
MAILLPAKPVFYRALTVLFPAHFVCHFPADQLADKIGFE